MFEIACQLAVDEMAQKKVRFEQGKRKSYNEGKVCSGFVCYGYRVNERGHVVIYEPEAEVIRYIFNSYANTDISSRKLFKELVDNGTFKPYSYSESGKTKILLIINNPAYSGGKSKTSFGNKVRKFEWNYPAIVSKELQEKAIVKCKAARTQSKCQTKYIYYAKSLVKCTCGYKMIGNSSLFTYTCPACHRVVQINFLDHVAWESAMRLKAQEYSENKRSTIDKYSWDIVINKKKIEYKEVRLVELDKLEYKAVKDASNITNNELHDKFLNEKLGAIKKERKDIKKAILTLLDSIFEMEKFLEKIEKDADAKIDYETLREIKDDTKRSEICREVIDSIELTEIDSQHLGITVNPNKAVADELKTSWVYDKTRVTRPHLIMCSKGEGDKDVTKEIVRRFSYTKRKRGLA